MGLVVNNIVKMEWEKSGFLTTQTGVFILASKEYESTKFGTVTVFFNCNTAFIWASDAHTADQDLWNAKELKTFLKDGIDGSFPAMYDEYVPVISWGSDSCNENVLEEYGIEAYANDILKRLADVVPYSNEEDKPCFA